jgi:hypothetical protein
VHYVARRRSGESISTAFVESAVNEINAKRMNKKQQMRWSRTTVQSFLDVRTAMLNDNLEKAFRHGYPGLRPANEIKSCQRPPDLPGFCMLSRASSGSARRVGAAVSVLRPLTLAFRAGSSAIHLTLRLDLRVLRMTASGRPPLWIGFSTLRNVRKVFAATRARSFFKNTRLCQECIVVRSLVRHHH